MKACPDGYPTCRQAEATGKWCEGKCQAMSAHRAKPDNPALAYRQTAAAPQPDQFSDAARYRWLRSQHWDTSLLAVVVDPKKAVKLGHDCPYGERLDEAIDAAMMAEKIVGAVDGRKGAL